jgi:aminocarboxymuconate-semialdehyde decarboxylase
VSEPVVDVHSAFVPQAYIDLMASRGDRYGMRLVERDGERFLISEYDVPIYGRGNPIPASTKHSDPQLRLRDMQATGVDSQVLTPPTNTFNYWLPPELGTEVCAVVNDAIAVVCRARPDRFVGVGQVPLQDTDRAIAELERCVRQLDLRGIEIGSSVNGEELDAPRLFPFFEAAASLDVPIFIHGSELPDARRFRDYSLATLLGIPAATTIAVARLIFGGVFERLPGLTMWLSHAGGVLPYLRGRFEHGYQVKAATRAKLGEPPSAAIDRLYYDTIAFHPPTLRYLLDMVGEDHVMLGTDYPFDDGEEDPVGFVNRVAGLSEEGRRKVLGGNAVRLLKLDRRPAAVGTARGSAPCVG